MIVEALSCGHFDRIEVQPSQVAHFELFTADVRAELVRAGSFAAVTPTGRTLAVGGIIDLGFGRGDA